jgi:hypothetical protein
MFDECMNVQLKRVLDLSPENIRKEHKDDFIAFAKRSNEERRENVE